MTWRTIRLELGRTCDFPSGSVSRGYLIRLPLTVTGAVDESALSRYPRRATVRRFWSSEPEIKGSLQRVNGRWALHCNGDPARFLGIAPDRIAVGDELSLTDSDGSRLPLRVASIGRVA